MAAKDPAPQRLVGIRPTVGRGPRSVEPRPLCFDYDGDGVIRRLRRRRAPCSVANAREWLEVRGRQMGYPVHSAPPANAPFTGPWGPILAVGEAARERPGSSERLGSSRGSARGSVGPFAISGSETFGLDRSSDQRTYCGASTRALRYRDVTGSREWPLPRMATFCLTLDSSAPRWRSLGRLRTCRPPASLPRRATLASGPPIPPESPRKPVRAATLPYDGRCAEMSPGRGFPFGPCWLSRPAARGDRPWVIAFPTRALGTPWRRDRQRGEIVRCRRCLLGDGRRLSSLLGSRRQAALAFEVENREEKRRHPEPGPLTARPRSRHCPPLTRRDAILLEGTTYFSALRVSACAAVWAARTLDGRAEPLSTPQNRQGRESGANAGRGFGRGVPQPRPRRARHRTARGHGNRPACPPSACAVRLHGRGPAPSATSVVLGRA